MSPDYLGRAVVDLAVTLEITSRLPEYTGMALLTGNPHGSPLLGTGYDVASLR